MTTKDVLIDVENERLRQDEKWGGPLHDDNHHTWEFVQLIEDYAGWADAKNVQPLLRALIVWASFIRPAS